MLLGENVAIFNVGQLSGHRGSLFKNGKDGIVRSTFFSRLYTLSISPMLQCIINLKEKSI